MKKIYSLLLLGGLLLFGVNNAWALVDGEDWYVGQDPVFVYFDNTNTQYNGVSIVAGRQYDYNSNPLGSQGYVMTEVEHTKLYFYTGGMYDHFTTLCFVNRNGEDSWGDYSASSVATRVTSYAKNGYTNALNDNVYTGHTYIYAAANDAVNGNDNTLSRSDVSSVNYDANLNHAQTIAQEVTYNAGTNYKTPTKSLASISVSGYKFNTNSTCIAITPNNFTASADYSDAISNSVAYTSTITMSVSSVVSGYEFEGWYENGTQISTNTSYSYEVRTGHNITARFRANAVALTVNVPISGCTNLKAYVWNEPSDALWTWGNEAVIASSVDEDAVYTVYLPASYDKVIWKWTNNSNAKQTIDLPFVNYKYIISSTPGVDGKYAASIAKHIVPTPDGFATFYSDDYFAELPVVSEQQVKAYTATISGDNTYLDLYVIENYNCVPKSTGVILKSVNAEYDVILKESATAGTVNGSHTNSLTGTSETISTPDNAYVLGYTTTTKFFPFTGASIPANKAYLVISSGSAPSAMRIIDEENTTTDINNIDASEEAVKFFQDGKLFIKKNGIVYDMMGTIVK